MPKFGFKNEFDFPIKFFKNEQVEFDKNSFEELENFLGLAKTIENLKNNDKAFFDNKNSKIAEVVITPDFHKGSGIPIGTVILTEGFIIPQAIGNDVNCGMRFYVTDLKEEDILKSWHKIEQKIRHIFFEGGREIPMCKTQRDAMFREGLTGLYETNKKAHNKGLWKYYDSEQEKKDILSVNNFGTFKTKSTFGLDDFIGTDKLSYDNQIGSIGGGNHFVEMQKVSELFDPQVAYLLGLKKDSIVIMLHTGSLAIGHLTGSHFIEVMKSLYPKNLKNPENGIYLLPETEKYKEEWELFWTSLYNSANFAASNRMFLGLMIKKALFEELGECKKWFKKSINKI